MNDYIKREDALDIVADNNVTGEITLNRYDKIIDGIYDIPSEDVVPVVPCKNCKHWDSDYMLEGCGDDVHYCPVVDKRKHETGYCDEAEEKNNL